jgi:uncharacterized protein (TIGR02588 family)
MNRMEPSNTSERLDDQPDHQSQQGKKRSQRTPAEWTTFSIASLILAGIVSLVVYVWFNQERQSPPILSVNESQSIREVENHFYVPFAVTNTGGNTAESVQIVAELEINGEVVESGEQQIDFLSGGETQEGAFIFSQDPRSGDLTVRVASYKLP